VKRRRYIMLGLAVLVLIMVSVVLGACGGGSDDPGAIYEKARMAFVNNDVAAAKEVFADDAVINWPQGADPAVSTGIDEITAMVKDYPVDPIEVGDPWTYVPSAKDLEPLPNSYKGASYVASPVRVEGNLYMNLVQIVDGKIVNNWITPMYR
jgi:hypothetical protein